MKTSHKNLSHAEIKNETGRDAQEVTAAWVVVLSLFTLALCVSVISPLAYLWIMGSVGMIATVVITIAGVHAMTSDGDLIGIFAAGEIVKTGFQVIDIILVGLAEASE